MNEYYRKEEWGGDKFERESKRENESAKNFS